MNLQSLYTSPDIRQIVDSTPLSFTASVPAGAVSATLSSSFGFATGQYIVKFTNGINGVNADQRVVTLTNGQTTATWFPGLITAAGSAFSAQSISQVSTAQNLTLSNAPVLLTTNNTTNGVVLNNSKDRIGWSIQNQGTNVVYVCLGAGASSTQLHYTLKAGTGAADGTGGSISFFSGAVYDGVVSVAGTSFSVSVVDLRAS